MTIKHVVLSVRCTVHTTANRSCSTQYTEVNIWAIVYSSWFPACPALSAASAAPPRPAPPCPLRPPARPFAPSASPPALACNKNCTEGAARSERSVFFCPPPTSRRRRPTRRGGGLESLRGHRLQCCRGPKRARCLPRTGGRQKGGGGRGAPQRGSDEGLGVGTQTSLAVSGTQSAPRMCLHNAGWYCCR